MDRKAIFNQPQTNITLGGMHILLTCITYMEDKLLVFERTEIIIEDNIPELWDFPTDFLLYGEDPETAISRIMKKWGLPMKSVRPLKIISTREDRQDWELNLLYAVEIPTLPDKGMHVENVRYIDTSDLPTMVGKFSRQDIAMLLAQIRWN